MSVSYTRIRHFNVSSTMMLLIRNYRTKVARKTNVGINNRLSIFKEENPEVDKLQINEKSLDELETELTSGREIVQMHTSNIEAMKKKIDLKIIERKYFGKIKMPNFLSWAEKEQLRDLHKTDPSNWTLDKLSQCFPATPHVIKKVIKSSWRPENSDKIKKHDEAVSKNWEKLIRGETHLDPVLKQHLIKFWSRQHIQHQDGDYNRIQMKVPSVTKGCEFSRIITDYKVEEIKSKEDTLVIENNEKVLSMKSGNMQICGNMQVETERSSRVVVNSKSLKAGNPRDKEMTTLQELRKTVEKQNSLSEYCEADKAFLKGAESGTSSLADTEDYENSPVKYSKKEKKIQTLAQVVDETPKDDLIPMRIQIPKDLPKGSVYKVQDVYYDTDGTYLYRVPGMKGSSVN